MAYLRSFKSKFNSFRRLSGKERWVLIQALVMLPVVAISLRLSGLIFTYKLLIRFSHKPMPYTLSSYHKLKSKEELPFLEQARIISILVMTAASNERLWTSCLIESLLLWWLLRLHNIESDLQIGVRRESAKFEAHAWVECQGCVLNDRQNVRQHFTPFGVSVQSWRVVK